MRLTAFQKNVVTMLIAPTMICVGCYVAEKTILAIDHSVEQAKRRRTDRKIRKLTMRNQNESYPIIIEAEELRKNEKR